jgi:molybdopterin-containing oxidoreductase family membrane subunit
MARVSGLFAALGVLNVLMFIPLMMALPPIQNPEFGQGLPGELDIRRTIWIQVPIGAPHWWDLLGIISLAVASLAILWLSSVPDMAEARLSSTGWRRKVYSLLAGHWYGTKRQWAYQKAHLAIMGALYFMMLIFVHFLIVSDYGMSMIPGWKDSILPPLYSVLGMQSALGLILIILFILRRWCGYRQYIGVSPFWSASKVLLGLTLLWVYHLFSFFITYWYGRLEVEQNIISYLLLDTYAGIFWPNVIFTFFAPFFLLIWNPVRRSDWGPALAGVLILIGCLLFNIRTFVAAFNAGNVYTLSLAELPPSVFPDIWDIFIVIGGLGLAALIYLLATKIFPVLSLWEIKEATKYQSQGPFMRIRSLVLAKPE